MIKLRTSYLLPAELAETTANYLKAIQEAGITDPFVLKIVDLLELDLEALQQALVAVRLNQLVSELSKLDALRDDLFIGFRDLVDANKRRRSEVIQEAYNKVWPVIEQAGTGLYRLGYTEQSGKLSALFNELDEEQYQPAMTTMNVKEIYEELKQAQVEFNNLYNERLEADQLADYPTLSEAKSGIAPHLNALISTFDILQSTTDGEFEELITQIDGITSSVMTVAKARKTRSENEATETEEEAPEEVA
ncbi:DUF6261 family protein [Reichenbachiella versicolor]|uniref:DUF6261 family protein n=1 Tax=Reichenbachiella versicolor TaxID=1821036 RepID=UPI000D6DFA11|nr:DUF6261 family protein [Reichenbachiella versicolor]